MQGTIEFWEKLILISVFKGQRKGGISERDSTVKRFIEFK